MTVISDSDALQGMEPTEKINVREVFGLDTDLIVHGFKDIENRKRKPWSSLMDRFVGIHAGKRMDHESEHAYATKHGLSMPLPHGALLGFAKITEVVTEIPRSCSIFIQSEVACLSALRPLMVPAN